MKTRKRVVTNYETEVDGVRYHVCIFFYDGEHYTAEWFSQDGTERGELGYSLGQCSEVEREVERRIQQQRRPRPLPRPTL